MVSVDTFVLLQSLVIRPNTKVLICVQRADRNTAILSNQPNELLANVLHVIILAKESDMIIHSRLGWLSDNEVKDECQLSYSGGIQWKRPVSRWEGEQDGD